ncbi:LPS export ABC transporter periplasmic protein LptC [Caenimonas sp. DR4.4]|uniref:LPS export ABC transporter periplasmic protein LptC n=1 Tax=Caenimonas aquaedulcis TaxID=2793270 RepID=A0A931H5F3_9BURK|nr:LPS export ABC transporter periplasmic protein LptC [Caenimonas aquaedulcis]MBG9388989.1 LPS export ABC transporter periplasmic protein LptC [Caenimonas aquaedulcis]
MRGGLDRASIYLPIILMGFMALGTYWLARNTPTLGGAESQKQVTHDPDYFMRRFSVKTFDATGRIKSEIHGSEARHYPDTDTLQIDQPRIRSFNDRGELTVATARTALSNADGSEVQLIGEAVVTREAPAPAKGAQPPKLEFRGDFLHVFVNSERIRSHKPVELVRGNDRFTADSLDYDNIGRVLELHGRVHGVIQPRAN